MTGNGRSGSKGVTAGPEAAATGGAVAGENEMTGALVTAGRVVVGMSVTVIATAETAPAETARVRAKNAGVDGDRWEVLTVNVESARHVAGAKQDQ